MADDSSTGFDGAKLITGGFAVITAVTGIIGSFTGALPRLIRNSSSSLNWAVLWVLVAIILGFVASELTVRSRSLVRTFTGLPPNEVLAVAGEATTTATLTEPVGRKEWAIARITLSVLSVIAFGVAAYTLETGLTHSIASSDQPRLSATWTIAAGQQPVLNVTLQLDQLQANDTVYVNAAPLNGSLADPTYRSQSGADADGKSDQTFAIVLPAGATGLQVVASVGHPVACDGASLAAVPAASGTVTATNTTVVINPTPTSPGPVVPTKSTSTGVLRPSTTPIVAPVTDANFSCVQVQAPIAQLTTTKPK